MELFSAADRQKIDQVNGVVRPLIERLVQAIRDKGISQSGLFSIYPIYFESNRIKKELRQMVFYAQNSEYIQELQLKAVLDPTRNFKPGDLYDLFQPLLASPDCTLMASILVKCLSVAFQSELENKQEERYLLIRKISAKNQQQQHNPADNKTGDMNDADQLALAKLSETMEKKRISLDVIWRELMLLFNQQPFEHKLVENRFSDLIFNGSPLKTHEKNSFSHEKNFIVVESFKITQDWKTHEKSTKNSFSH